MVGLIKTSLALCGTYYGGKKASEASFNYMILEGNQFITTILSAALGALGMVGGYFSGVHLYNSLEAGAHNLRCIIQYKNDGCEHYNCERRLMLFVSGVGMLLLICFQIKLNTRYNAAQARVQQNNPPH